MANDGFGSVFHLHSSPRILWPFLFRQSHHFIFFPKTSFLKSEMYSKSITVSVALLALVPSAFSAPLPAPAASAHSELKARLSLPSGALGSIIKSLGTGILTGGAFTGLLGLLGEHGESDAAPAQNAALVYLVLRLILILPLIQTCPFGSRNPRRTWRSSRKNRRCGRGDPRVCSQEGHNRRRRHWCGR